MKNRWAASWILFAIAVPCALHARTAGRMVEVNGTTLWCDVRGGGPGTPLVILNGGPGVSHSYMLISSVWDSLARRRSVVFYDQRGTGLSPALRKGQSCTVADQIADLEALRALLGFQRIDVLGHSWGGMIAMGYAEHHSDHVDRMILCDSTAPRWADTKFLFDDLFPEASARQESLHVDQHMVDTATVNAYFREYQSMLACDPDRRALMRDGALPAFSMEVNAKIQADLKTVDLWPALPKLSVPTLVLCGRFDANVAPSGAWKIHNAIPHSEFTVFERSGHLPFYEEPAAFIERVERFLGAR